RGESPGTVAALSHAARTALASVRSQNPAGPFGTGGATPTGLSLQFFSSYAPLQDPYRLELLLLLTDGLPNCNGAIGAANCICTGAANTCPPQIPTSFSCLDKDRTVQAVQDLAARGVHVVVIGVGRETPASLDGGRHAP